MENRAINERHSTKTEWNSIYGFFDIEIYKSYLNFNFESKNLLIPFSLPIKFTDIFRRRALKREGSMAEFFLDTILPRGRPIENT